MGLGAADPVGKKPVHQPAGDQQGDEAPIPGGVEDPAGQQQEPFAGNVVAAEAPGDRIDHQEKQPELHRRKKH
jgi:hypothetical protein